MKVNIPVRKTVTETVELPQLPYYSNRFGTIFYTITEDQVIVQVANKQISFWRPDDMYYGEHLVEAYQADECTKKEFDNMVAATIGRINEVLNPAKGAVTNTMNTDPNNAQASEPTTEQVAAVEQEAQEQAMESAEEGGAEG